MNIVEFIRARRPRQSTVTESLARQPERRLEAPNDRVCGLSDTGEARDSNEDAFYLSATRSVFIVADGMGGHQSGAIASAVAIDIVRDRFEVNLETDGQAIETLMVDSLMAGHQEVVRLGAERPECEGMGTTLLLAFISGSRLYTCHAGDVRCYVRSVSGFRQLTQDHSVVASLVRDALITPEQARFHPRKNEILQAIGAARSLAPDVNSIELCANDRVLICTDGLWEALPDSEIASVLGWDGTMRQVATQLVDRAVGSGVRDNLTVVLYEHATE